MRVAVVGAGTAIGRRVARDLAEHPEVAGVELIGEPGQLERATGEPAGDIGVVMGEALSRADVMIGCQAGDPEGDRSSAEAAIGAGIPYLSTCEGVEAFEAIASLDEKARSSGTLVVPGLGWAPGMTNVLARAGAELMDEVSAVRISWVTSIAGEAGPEALLRAMRSLSGHVPVFEDGGWHRSKTGVDPERVYFPEPVGWRKVHMAEGPEVLTLPETLPAVGHVTVRGGVTETSVDAMARRFSELFALAPSTQRERVMSAARPVLPWIGRLSGARHTWSAARVDVRGVAGGMPRVATFGVLDQYANLMSAPLVAGALMVGRGEIKGSGVLPAETVIAPNDFFVALAERGVRVARLQR